MIVTSRIHSFSRWSVASRHGSLRIVPSLARPTRGCISAGTERAFGFSAYAEHVESASPSEPRLRALLEAGVALTSELSLDSLLQRLTELAAELTGARYAALGVIDPTGSRLERFVTHGIDAETRTAIGDPPQGRGILGALIHDARPLRLHAIADDPRSVGFPPNHPPMTKFLGVPVLLRGIAYGNLYLTDKAAGEEFTDADQELVELLASQAAVAIENARLYEASTRWSRQLESLIEVSGALARETDVDVLLELLAERLRELIAARLVVVALPAGGDELRIVTAAGDGAEDVTGRRIELADTKAGQVLERARTERVDSLLEDPEVNVEFTRGIGARAGLWVPLLVGGRPLGVLTAYDKVGAADARFTHDDVRLAETFASRAAVAVELSERVERDALRRIVAAQELERQRLARELHDETGQALTSILLGLRQLEGAEPESVAQLRELVVATLQDVRRLAVELRPKVLDDFGLVPALERLTGAFAEQTGIDVDLEAGAVSERLPAEVETAIYRIVQESLTNVVKHSRAQRVSVLLTRANGSIKVVIEDDGTGFDPDAARSDGIGLIGMRERIELLDGTLAVESSETSGTTVAVEVPV
jgi:two-component system, NarL family, sensor histidine kinase DevS